MDSYLVVSDGDIRIFSTVAEAQSWMEPPEVRTGEHSLYRSNGEKLLVKVVVERKRSLFGETEVEQVVVEVPAPPQDAKEELRQHLLRYFEVTKQLADPSEPLDDLIAKLDKFINKKKR